LTTLSDDLDVYAMVVDNATNIKKSDNDISNCWMQNDHGIWRWKSMPCLGKAYKCDIVKRINQILSMCSTLLYTTQTIRRSCSNQISNYTM